MEFTVQHMEKLLTILDGFNEIEGHLSALFNTSGLVEGYSKDSPLWKASQILDLIRELSPLLTPEEARLDYEATEFGRVMESDLSNAEKAAMLMCVTQVPPDSPSDPNSPPW